MFMKNNISRLTDDKLRQQCQLLQQQETQRQLFNMITWTPYLVTWKQLWCRQTEMQVLTGMLKDEQEKPTFSYIGLIAMAILDSKEKRLVLGDIYKWILDHYPYFQSRGTGWRNSIRHNLSLNDCFVKSDRCSSGKGHYWAIHNANLEDFGKGDFRRKKALRKARRAIMQMGENQEKKKEKQKSERVEKEKEDRLKFNVTNLLRKE